MRPIVLEDVIWLWCV